MPPLVFALSVVLAPGQPPTTDKAFAEVDREIRTFMERIRAEAATVAISREGKLLHSRGFGYRDRRRREPTPADAQFRVGSISKAVTAAAIKELVRAGKLEMRAPVFGLLDLAPLGGGRRDERLSRITLEDLLEHRGGWDAERSFDPLFRAAIVQRELSLRRPITPEELTRWMLGRRLDFDPGTATAYSNFGYCVLGRVLEKATGKTYEKAIKELALAPWKIEHIRVARRTSGLQEVTHPPTNPGFVIEVFDSCAGLTASAPACCAFLHRYWVNGDRRTTDRTGEWHFFGSLPGAMALAQQRRDGVDVVALFNNRRDREYESDKDLLLKKVTAAVDRALDP